MWCPVDMLMSTPQWPVAWLGGRGQPGSTAEAPRGNDPTCNQPSSQVSPAHKFCSCPTLGLTLVFVVDLAPPPLSSSVLDDRRTAYSLAVSPLGNLAAATDCFGRVLLVDTRQLLVTRMWKGTPLQLVVYSLLKTAGSKYSASRGWFAVCRLS